MHPFAAKSCFILPFGRDSQFVAREDILEEIDARFSEQTRVAIYGIGGVG
jgi:hypothetical protein